MARQLRPDVLRDLGLRSALAAVCTELFAHGGTRVRRKVVPGFPVLDEAVELVVFRVAQEALTNAARHAHARHVELTMGLRGDEVWLRVTDDGVGLGPQPGGTGLRGMQERAQLVGGRIDVRRAEGGGTSVELFVPVPAR